MKKLYVGNLSYDVTDQDLFDLFAEHGQVESASVIIDKFNNRSKGFAFVEMDDEGADKAIAELDGVEHFGRNLKVNVARPKEDSGRRGDRRDRGGDRRGGGDRGGFRKRY